jgi:hypothetical protein
VFDQFVLGVVKDFVFVLVLLEIIFEVGEVVLVVDLYEGVQELLHGGYVRLLGHLVLD